MGWLSSRGIKKRITKESLLAVSDHPTSKNYSGHESAVRIPESNCSSPCHHETVVEASAPPHQLVMVMLPDGGVSMYDATSSNSQLLRVADVIHDHPGHELVASSLTSFSSPHSRFLLECELLRPGETYFLVDKMAAHTTHICKPLQPLDSTEASTSNRNSYSNVALSGVRKQPLSNPRKDKDSFVKRTNTMDSTTHCSNAATTSGPCNDPSLQLFGHGNTNTRGRRRNSISNDLKDAESARQSQRASTMLKLRERILPRRRSLVLFDHKEETEAEKRPQYNKSSSASHNCTAERKLRERSITTPSIISVSDGNKQKRSHTLDHSLEHCLQSNAITTKLTAAHGITCQTSMKEVPQMTQHANSLTNTINTKSHRNGSSFALDRTSFFSPSGISVIATVSNVGESSAEDSDYSPVSSSGSSSTTNSSANSAWRGSIYGSASSDSFSTLAPNRGTTTNCTTTSAESSPISSADAMRTSLLRNTHRQQTMPCRLGGRSSYVASSTKANCTAGIYADFLSSPPILSSSHSPADHIMPSSSMHIYHTREFEGDSAYLAARPRTSQSIIGLSRQTVTATGASNLGTTMSGSTSSCRINRSRIRGAADDIPKFTSQSTRCMTTYMDMAGGKYHDIHEQQHVTEEIGMQSSANLNMASTSYTTGSTENHEDSAYFISGQVVGQSKKATKMNQTATMRRHSLQDAGRQLTSIHGPVFAENRSLENTTSSILPASEQIQKERRFGMRFTDFN